MGSACSSVGPSSLMKAAASCCASLKEIRYDGNVKLFPGALARSETIGGSHTPGEPRTLLRCGACSIILKRCR